MAKFAPNASAAHVGHRRGCWPLSVGSSSSASRGDFWVRRRGSSYALRALRGVGDGAVVDSEAELYLKRQMSFDPDIWVLEIEDPESCYELDGPVLT